MLNVDLVGHRKPEFRAIRVIRVQKPRTPGRLYGKVDTKLSFQELLVIGLTE